MGLLPELRKNEVLHTRTKKNTNKKKIKIATYGTLKKGGAFHYYLEDEEFLGDQWISGWEMYRTKEGYMTRSIPYVIKGEGKIFVEVYNVSLDTFNKIEYLEHGYDKKIINTKYGDAVIYYVEELPPEANKRVEDGKF